MTETHRYLRDGFGSVVARTGRQRRRAVDRRLQRFGLSEAAWLPLIHLARAPAPMRQKDLAAALALDGSSVVRLLDALATARSHHPRRRRRPPGQDHRGDRAGPVDHRAGGSGLARRAQRHAGGSLRC